jgi:hypothetical protein
MICFMEEGKEKDYKFFMNVLMETDILVDKPRSSYVHGIDIEKSFEQGQYFKAIMHLSCLIESNLYQLFLKKLPIPPTSLKAFQVKKMQELPFKVLINWGSGEPISKRFKLEVYPEVLKEPLLDKFEKSVLNELRKIRNEIAHIPYLNYDQNINKGLVREMITKVSPIHGKLVEELIKYQKK